MGFLSSSDDKESACNAGDPGSTPGLGRSPGEGIGYLLQYSWASLVAQMVKNLPVMRETWVPSVGWEDPLEEGMATHSSILAWKIPIDRGAWRATVHAVSKSWTRLRDFTFTFSRGSSQARDRIQVSHIAGRFFNRATREAQEYWSR